MRIETFADLATLPPQPPFLIDGVLPARALTMIYGASGSGKTFIALDMAHAIATGRPWLGRSVKPGRALYVAAEGAAGFPGRAQAWHRARGRPSLDGMRYLREPLAVHEPEKRELLCALLQADEFRPDLIVIDTASANGPPGFDDSKAEHWKAIFDATADLMRTLRCGAVFIHHPGHAGDRLRGSYDQIARADVIIRIEKAGELAARLKLEKTRDFGWEGWIDIGLKKVHCTNSDADEAMSLVPELSETRPGALTTAQLTALKTIAKADKPLRAGEWETATGLPRRTFYAARLQLVTSEFVTTKGSTYVCADTGRAAILKTLAASEVQNGAKECNGTSGRSGASSAAAPRPFRGRGGTAAHAVHNGDGNYEAIERLAIAEEGSR